MPWLVRYCPNCSAFGCIAFIAWRKWIAPWRLVEDVITQIVAVNGRAHF